MACMTEQQWKDYAERNKVQCWPEAPFDRDGNMLSYPEWGSEMREVTPFYETITFVGFNRGRSAANATFKRKDGTDVIVFLHDMEQFVSEMDGGNIDAMWTYCKRGQNYGVKRA